MRPRSHHPDPRIAAQGAVLDRASTRSFEAAREEDLPAGVRGADTAVPGPVGSDGPQRSVRRRLYAVCGGLLLVVSALLASVESHDLWTAVRPFGWQDPHLGPLWELVSDLARGQALIGVLLVAVVFSHDGWRRQLVLTSAIVPALVGTLLKFVVARPRPIPDFGSMSWPSGHAISALALAMALSAGRSRPRWWVWVVAVAIAVSRVAVERHWPSDVIASAGIVVLTVPLLSRLPVWIPTGRVPRQSLVFVGIGWTAVTFVGMAADPWGRGLPRALSAFLGLVLVLGGLGVFCPERPETGEPGADLR